MTDKLITAHYTRTYAQHGYDFCKVTIMRGSLFRTETMLAECEGNKAGYGNPETAVRMAHCYQQYLDRGIFEVFEEGCGSQRATVNFLKYKPYDGVSRDYDPVWCQPDYYLGKSLRDIAENMKLVACCRSRHTKSGRYVRAPESPEQLVARFPKAIKLAYVKGDYDGITTSHLVPARYLDLEQAETKVA